MSKRNESWPHWELIEEVGVIVVYFSRLEIYMLGLLKATGFEEDPWKLFGRPQQIVSTLKRQLKNSPFPTEINNSILNFSDRFDQFREKRNDIIHSAWLHQSDGDSEKNYYRVSPTGNKALKRMEMRELKNFKFEISNFYDHIELLFELNRELPAWRDVDICPKGFESLRPYIVVE